MLLGYLSAIERGVLFGSIALIFQGRGKAVGYRGRITGCPSNKLQIEQEPFSVDYNGPVIYS